MRLVLLDDDDDKEDDGDDEKDAVCGMNPITGSSFRIQCSTSSLLISVVWSVASHFTTMPVGACS